MSGVGRLKFKGEKTKKKRVHREKPADDGLEALAAADPRGWMFPMKAEEVSGPTFVLFPAEPLTCLAWDSSRSRVVAAPVDLPEAPEGAPELSTAEQLAVVEPSDVNHVWVVSRLAGSTGVTLRSADGSFLSALPSGRLDVSASRGPLESFLVELDGDGKFALKSEQSGKFIICSGDRAAVEQRKAELRCDGDEPQSGTRAKCQAEYIVKARLGDAARKRAERGGADDDDERREGLSDRERRELKRARKEGRGAAEAMLDRRAKKKSDKYC